MKLSKVLLLIFMFGFYSRFNLVIGPIYIPFFFSFFAGALLFFVRNFRISKSSFSFIIIISIVTSLVTILTLLLYDVEAREVIESYVLFIYSIVLSVIFADELMRYDNDALSKLLYKISIVILVLSVLDIFIQPFHQINLFVLELMGGHNQGAYAADRESAIFFGIRRPFPFTLEPSHVSKFLMITLSGWLLLAKKKKYILFYLLCFLSLVIIRSPIIIGAGIAGLLFQITDSNSRTNYVKFASVVLVVVIIGLIGTVFAYFILESRLRSLSLGNDISTYVRIVQPFLILKESLLYSPYLGVGIGNTEKLASIFIENNPAWLGQDLGRGYTVSSLIAPLAYWGILGSLLHLIPFINYSSKRFNISISNIFILIVLYFLISISMGGFNTVNYWAYILMILRMVHEND